MFKTLKGIVIGSVLALLLILPAFPVLGESVQKGITVVFKNINVSIYDNFTPYISEKSMTEDTAGNPIEAIVYDNTTYVPVRSISDMFHKDVIWNESDNTVIIKDRIYNNGNYPEDGKKVTVEEEFSYDGYHYLENLLYIQFKNNSELDSVLKEIRVDLDLEYITIKKYDSSIDVFMIEIPVTITEDIIKYILELDSVAYACPLLMKTWFD
jgi:hypothetical protein